MYKNSKNLTIILSFKTNAIREKLVQIQIEYTAYSLYIYTFATCDINRGVAFRFNTIKCYREQRKLIITLSILVVLSVNIIHQGVSQNNKIVHLALMYCCISIHYVQFY